MTETLTNISESDNIYAPMSEDEIKENEQTNELNGLLEELTSDNTAEIGVYRTKNGRAKGSFLFRCTPSDFTLSELMEKLRDEYGGGEFRMHVKKNHRLVANRELSVEPATKTDAVIEKPADNSQDITALILAMNENAASRDAAARESMSSMMQANQQNMLDLFKVLASNKPEPVQQTSPTDLIAMIASIQSMTQDNTPKTDPVEMLMRGLELGKDMGGGETNPLSEMVKAAAGPLAAIATQAQTAQPAIKPPARKSEIKQLDNKALEPLDTFEAPAEPEQENTNMLQFLPYITMLKNAAAINAEVGTYANMILDQMGDDVYAYVVDDAKYAGLVGYIPDSANHKLWFDNLRAAILECFNDELALDENAPGDSNELNDDMGVIDVHGPESTDSDDQNIPDQKPEILSAHD